MSHQRISGEAADPDPISIGITRHVRSDHVHAFEAWLDEIKSAAGAFDGYAGMDVVRPADADNPTYVIILRFDSLEHYTAWHESPERGEAVERSLAMTTGDPLVEEAHGLEAWFTPSAVPAGVERPARYKMTVLTIIGLYPPIVAVGALVAAATGLPGALATLVTVTIVAALATYWVMPWITRGARPWLYPAETTGGSS
jgi:antibiotic biosynthesis monooxygenase (ABM) superfamily enzyme